MLKPTFELMNEYREHPILNLGCGNWFGDVCVDLYEYPKTIKHDLNKGDLPIEKKFKTIYCFGTIFYLKNPEILLKEAKRLLEDNGTFIISTTINKKKALEWSHKRNIPEWCTDMTLKEFKILLQKYFIITKEFTFRFRWVYFICKKK